MKTRLFRKTMRTGIFLGLLPLFLYAAEVAGGPSQKTSEPKEEIIQMLKAKNEKDESAANKSMSAGLVLKKEEKAKVYFRKGSETLDAKAKTVLNETATWLKNNPQENLIIEGHGNEYKNRERNLMLGELRAGSVLSYLVKQGISERRLTAVSYGSERSGNKRMARKYGVKNWRVCFLVVEKISDGKSVVQKKSSEAQPMQKESKDKKPVTETQKEPVKEEEEKEPVKVEPKRMIKETKKEKPVKEPVKKKEEKKIETAKQPQDDKKIVEAKTSVMRDGPQDNNKIAEGKKFFEKFTTLMNNYDPKVMELYSEYAVIYMPDGPSAAQNQTGALILEKARPILLEALSKAKAQNATVDFSDIKYSLEGKKVRINSTRNSKPHSMIIGKNAKNEWKIEEEVLQIQ